MKKIEPVVIKETLYILAFTVILSAVMESAYLIAGRWNVWILIGNAAGILAAVGNFFLMALTVQISVSKEEKEAKGKLHLSRTFRMIGLLAFAVAAYLIKSEMVVPLVVTYLFPRVGIALRPLLDKKKGGDGVA